MKPLTDSLTLTDFISCPGKYKLEAQVSLYRSPDINKSS